MDIINEAVSEFRSGSGVVGVTAQAIGTGQVRKHVVIRANGGNTGTISIGTTKINAVDGFILAAGNQTPPIYVEDLSKVFIVGSAANQGYSWLAS